MKYFKVASILLGVAFSSNGNLYGSLATNDLNGSSLDVFDTLWKLVDFISSFKLNELNWNLNQDI